MCRDGTFDSVNFDQGVLRIPSLIPNSFLAVSEEGHETVMNYPVDMACTELKNYAVLCPHLVATTKVFRMSDCHYADDGTRISWRRDSLLG